MPASPTAITPAETAEPLTINKMVVVGHPLSGYEGVESLLNTCGMRPASPSQRDGLSAAQVGATLLKAHRVLPLDTLQPHGPIQPLQPGPIWQSLALDLLLGNLDHDLWGWSDPQAIYLLDYWKSLDPQLAFMLVYDTPQELIARAFDNPAVACTPETIQIALDNWNAYNDALLQFYHRNPQRCMLVHAAQVRARAADYLHQVHARIGAPLTPAPNHGDPASPSGVSTLQISGEPATSMAEPLHPADATPANHHHTLRAYVAQALLTQQPEALQRYEELQASAILPLAEQTPNTSADLALQAVVALQVQATQQHTTQREALAALEAEKTALSTQLSAQMAAEKAAHQNAAHSSQQEADLLLAQLHQVQEELERHYLAHQEAQKKLADLNQVQQQTERLAAERQKQIEQLQTQIKQATEQAKTSASAAKQAEERAAQVQQLTQAKATVDKLAAERQKQIEQLQTQLKQATEQAKKAPEPLPANPELQQENDLLLAQLHQIQEELERYYLENQRLKAKAPAPAKPAQAPAPYGAAERVKQQLSYRLGSKMIEKSRTLGGWLGMPFALMAVARQYKRELPQRQATKQVPIAKYRDAHEAERVKQHLSYRLGTVLLQHSKNPLRWPALPFALRETRRAWRSQQAR